MTALPHYRGHTAAPGSVCQHRPAVSGSEGEGTCHENGEDVGVLATWGLGSGWRVCHVSTFGTRGFTLFSGGLKRRVCVFREWECEFQSVPISKLNQPAPGGPLQSGPSPTFLPRAWPHPLTDQGPAGCAGAGDHGSVFSCSRATTFRPQAPRLWGNSSDRTSPFRGKVASWTSFLPPASSFPAQVRAGPRSLGSAT